MATEDMIAVEGFKKTFFVGLRRRGSVAARNIGFEVQKGEIFGFLGPNGAGKTTTIKALLGLIRPDAGKLSLMGHAPASLAWRARVGYMPEHPNFYDYLSGFEMVVWFGRLSGLTRAEAERQANRMLDRVGLGTAMHRRLRSYSKGMLQRAGLAQALVSSPELLILDEPMTGLDPMGRRDIRALILGLRDEGKTIFYSTHILPDVEMTCDRVSIIHGGITKRTGRLKDILSETTRGYSVVVTGLATDRVEAFQKQHPSATFVDGALEVQLPDEPSAQAFVRAAAETGARLVRFEPHKDDLETIFVRSLGEPEEVPA